MEFIFQTIPIDNRISLGFIQKLINAFHQNLTDLIFNVLNKILKNSYTHFFSADQVSTNE
jgi:hypothetical protein